MFEVLFWIFTIGFFVFFGLIYPFASFWSRKREEKLFEGFATMDLTAEDLDKHV